MKVAVTKFLAEPLSLEEKRVGSMVLYYYVLYQDRPKDETLSFVKKDSERTQNIESSYTKTWMKRSERADNQKANNLQAYREELEKTLSDKEKTL